MSLAPHPEAPKLRRAMERCAPRAAEWSGNTFRMTTVPFANSTDLLTGLGSKIHGGRWNPKGGFEAVYLSLDIDTMIAEVFGRGRRSGFDALEFSPRVLVTIRCRLNRVLDLTDGETRRQLQISRDRMTGEPWQDCQHRGEEALTQALGRCAWELALEGLLVPSAAWRGGLNLVVFPGRLSKSSRLKVVDAEELPHPRPK